MERITIKKPLKILYVVHGFPPTDRAGTELHTYYFSKEMAKKNEVHIFYPKITRSNKALNSYKQEDLYIHEYVLQDNFFSKISRSYRFLSLKNTYTKKSVEFIFKKLLKTIKPDIIHFEHLIGLSIRLIEFAHNFNIPSVITLHDYWFICPKIQLLTDDYSICNGPTPDGKKCYKCFREWKVRKISNYLNKYHISSKLSISMIRTIFNKKNSFESFKERNEQMKKNLLLVNKIIAPSQFLRNVFIKYGIPKDKIIFSENGYNLKLFNGFKKKEKKSKKIIFGYVGGIHKHKGIHLMIDAFSDIDNKKAELRIYGKYNPNLPYVKNIKTKSETKRNIKFIGGFEDVRTPYSEIDVLIVPSIWAETGGPLVLKEGLITRTPVIASNIGCIPEFIKNEANGLLFEKGNISDLNDKIMFICNNRKILNTFKKNIPSVKLIKEQAEEIIKIYREIKK